MKREESERVSGKKREMSTSWTLTLHPLMVVMLVAGLVPPTAFLMVKSLESTSSHAGEHLGRV